MTQKYCNTCKHRRKDLECFIDHCEHPDFITFDPVKGNLMMPIKQAAEKCHLNKWERPGFWQRLLG